MDVKPVDRTAIKPPSPVSVHFLGTCSGGGPITSRNCSSLAVDFGNEIWLFDCADGTLNRLFQSPLKTGNITRFFITHMHADHVLGLVWVLAHLMSGIGTKDEETERLRRLGVDKKASIHIYGPSGLRQLIRTTLNLTSVNLGGVFAVHELLHPGCEPSATCAADDLHPNEAVGQDIRADENEVWEEVLPEGSGKGGKSWAVKAGPITHRGYILQEPIPRLPLDTASLIPLLQSNASALAELSPPIKHPLSLLSHLTSLPPPKPFTLPSGETLSPPEPSGIPPRKLVIFGDCSGGTKNPHFKSMCSDPSLLVHECTNAAIPELIQRGEKGRTVRTKDVEPSLMGPSGYGKVGDQGPTDPEEQGRKEREDKMKGAVKNKAQSRGHSTPDEVGEFAGKIRARRVVVNHFSAMFPSPKYTTSEPFPSILSGTSPYPYPVPSSLPYKLGSNRLSGGELHLRLIMQSLANQINTIWSAAESSSKTPWADSNQMVNEKEDQVVRPGTPATFTNGEAESVRMAVPARDFMVYRVPAHELTTNEIIEMKDFSREVKDVEEKWRKDGGVFVRQDTGDEPGKRWVGIDPAPTSE